MAEPFYESQNEHSCDIKTSVYTPRPSTLSMLTSFETYNDNKANGNDRTPGNHHTPRTNPKFNTNTYIVSRRRTLESEGQTTVKLAKGIQANQMPNHSETQKHPRAYRKPYSQTIDRRKNSSMTMAGTAAESPMQPNASATLRLRPQIAHVLTMRMTAREISSGA